MKALPVYLCTALRKEKKKWGKKSNLPTWINIKLLQTVVKLHVVHYSQILQNKKAK